MTTTDLLLARLPWRWIVFGAAFLLRLGYIAQGGEVPPQDTPDYDEIALNLLAGEGFVARDAFHGAAMYSWRAPFYPFFLALVYLLCGYDHLWVKIAQALVGAATAVLIYDLGRRLYPPAALSAGLLLAVYGPLAASPNEVMTETWFAFWLVLAVHLLISPPAAAATLWLGGGLAIGLAALTRPAGLLLLPAFALAALWHRQAQWGRRTLWVGLGLCLAVGPWTLRNYLVHDAFVAISTHGGFIVARSNADNPDWRQPHAWGIQPSFMERFPTEVERDRYWWRQGLSWIAAHPAAYAQLVGERLLRFWYFMRPQYNFWLMVILPFFLAGLYHFWNRDGFFILSAFMGLSLAVFCLLLYGSSRFRLPLEPFFCLFAAAYLSAQRPHWSTPRTLTILGTVVGANVILYFGSAVLHQWVLNILTLWNLK